MPALNSESPAYLGLLWFKGIAWDFWRIWTLRNFSCDARLIRRIDILRNLSIGSICTTFWRIISIHSNLFVEFFCFSRAIKHSFKSCRILWDMPSYSCIFPISSFWQSCESKRPWIWHGRWFGHIQRRPPEAPVHSGWLKRAENVKRGGVDRFWHGRSPLRETWRIGVSTKS